MVKGYSFVATANTPKISEVIKILESLVAIDIKPPSLAKKQIKMPTLKMKHAADKLLSLMILPPHSKKYDRPKDKYVTQIAIFQPTSLLVKSINSPITPAINATSASGFLTFIFILPPCF